MKMTVKQLQKRIDAVMKMIQDAADVYGAETSALYLKNGKQRYSDELHAKKLKEAQTAFKEAYDEAAKEVETIPHDVQAYGYMVKAPPSPYEGLSNDDLGRLANLRPLIKEDFEEMPIDELTATINAARLRDTDKMELDLYQRYGERRRRAELDAMKQSETTDTNHTMKIRQLKNALDSFPKPDVSDELEKVEELVRAAMEAKRFVYNTYNNATGEAKRQLDEYYAGMNEGSKQVIGGSNLAGAVQGGTI